VPPCNISHHSSHPPHPTYHGGRHTSAASVRCALNSDPDTRRHRCTLHRYTPHVMHEGAAHGEGGAIHTTHKAALGPAFASTSLAGPKEHRMRAGETRESRGGAKTKMTRWRGRQRGQVHAPHSAQNEVARVCAPQLTHTVLHSKKHGSPDVWRRAREDATTNHALPRIVDGRDIPPHTRVADSAGPWTAQQTRWRARPRGAPYCWQWMRGSRHKGRATQHESLSAWLPRGTGGHVTREFERVAATWHGRPRDTRV